MPHDRYGERIDDDVLSDQDSHGCRGGWIDRDGDRPRPCLRCRPHLSPTRRAPVLPDAEQVELNRAGIQRCRAALAQTRGHQPPATTGEPVTDPDLTRDGYRTAVAMLTARGDYDVMGDVLAGILDDAPDREALLAATLGAVVQLFGRVVDQVTAQGVTVNVDQALRDLGADLATDTP
jgi:hypothetical protein